MGASKQNIDFTNVKEGGNFSKKHMPEADYLAKITKVEDAKPKDTSDKSAMWLFTVQLKGTPSATYPYYCKLQENQLWKVRNLLVAAGLNVPKKMVSVDPNRVVGKLIAVSLQDTEYEGKIQSEIGSIFSPSELEGVEEDSEVDMDEDDDEARAPKKYKAPASVGSDDEDDEEEPAPKAKKKKVAEPEPAPKAKKKKKAAVEDDDEIEIEDL